MNSSQRMNSLKKRKLGPDLQRIVYDMLNLPKSGCLKL